MPHLHLPAEHTDEDLALAGALASMLRSEELYVAWSTDAGQSAPVIPAALHEPALPPALSPRRSRRRSIFARIFGLR
jgi:hypothetical protein